MANSRGFRQAPRRRRSWTLGPGRDTPQTTVSASVASIISDFIAVGASGTTLARLRGDFRAQIITASSSMDGFSGAFGIGVATNAAITAGAASVPTPVTEQDWNGWLYWRAFNLKSVETTVVGRFGSVLQWQVDTKAMRKLDPDDGVYAVFEVTEVGTSTMQVFFDSRMLVLLP